MKVDDEAESWFKLDGIEKKVWRASPARRYFEVMTKGS